MYTSWGYNFNPFILMDLFSFWANPSLHKLVLGNGLLEKIN